MAKADAKAATAAKDKKEKKVRAPKEYQLPLHTRGNEQISQSVSHVRGMGVLVTTVALGPKGEAVGVTTTWIPGLKPKSKNGERFLVEDKGPKPKKAKTDKKGK